MKAADNRGQVQLSEARERAFGPEAGGFTTSERMRRNNKTNNRSSGACHPGEKQKGIQSMKSQQTIKRGAVWTAPVELAALAGTILAGAVAWI